MSAIQQDRQQGTLLKCMKIRQEREFKAIALSMFFLAQMIAFGPFVGGRGSMLLMYSDTFIYLLAVLEIELRVLQLLGKHSIP
jgi:hypothetical protein